MQPNRNQHIATSFGQRCETYDRVANLQKQVAKDLATHLPDLTAPNILEIGCGTGFLTREILKKYPDGIFDITDLSQDMVNKCQENNNHDNINARFYTLDGETSELAKNYDLIVSSMTFQWFNDPVKTVQKLSAHAPVYYTSLGGNNFPEWKKTLKQHNISDGTLPSTNWSNIMTEEFIKENHESGHAFFKYLKSIGAVKSKDKHSPEKYTRIKKAFNDFDGNITWHIIYGHEPLSR